MEKSKQVALDRGCSKVTQLQPSPIVMTEPLPVRRRPLFEARESRANQLSHFRPGALEAPNSWTACSQASERLDDRTEQHLVQLMDDGIELVGLPTKRRAGLSALVGVSACDGIRVDFGSDAEHASPWCYNPSLPVKRTSPDAPQRLLLIDHLWSI